MRATTSIIFVTRVNPCMKNSKRPCKQYNLHRRDCLSYLKTLTSNSIDSIVTDPPGGLSFMEIDWDSDRGGRDRWIKWLTKRLTEAYRVLKPGGHLVIWTFPRTSHWTRMALDDFDFQFVHNLIHVFGTGKSHGKIVKSADSPEFNGFSTTLKTSYEEWVLVRKPSEGTVANNLRKWKVGALNVEACSIEGAPGQPSRFPGTLVHDGSVEALRIFPDAPGQLARLRGDGAPMNNHVYGKMNHGTVAKPPRIDTDSSAARFFYCTKASRSDKNGGLHNGEINCHPTVKSIALMRWLCRLVTPPGGTVLDMFMGSGSTGVAAMLEGFGFIGCELSEEYFAIAKKRITHAWASRKRPTRPSVFVTLKSSY